MKTAIRRLVVIIALGFVLLGACGSSDTAAPTESGSSPMASAAPLDSTEFCAVFSSLAATRSPEDQTSQRKDQAGWDQNLLTVQHIAAVAPAEIKAQADAYVQMVKDRAELAANNGYVSVDELPAEARNEFISTHRELQAQVNELIAFAKNNCSGLT